MASGDRANAGNLVFETAAEHLTTRVPRAAPNAEAGLAFFMPGVVYLADAVGAQTETLVIRGLSVGVSLRQVVWRELLTGLLVGLSLSAAFYPVALWLWQDTDLTLTVSMSLLAACATASLEPILKFTAEHAETAEKIGNQWLPLCVLRALCGY